MAVKHSFPNEHLAVSETQMLSPTTAAESTILTNVITVTPLEVIPVEVFDLVADDNAEITVEQISDNSVKLFGAGDVTVVTGDLASVDNHLLNFNPLPLANGSKTETATQNQLSTSDTYFLSGNYDTTTGLFTTTTEGAGNDTLVYAGASATALSVHTNAVILVGVDSNDIDVSASVTL